MNSQEARRHKHISVKVIISVFAAFALAFTLLPSCEVCAEDQTTEPTQSASDMVNDNDGDTPSPDVETPSEEETTISEEEPAETETESETTAPESVTTTESPELMMKATTKATTQTTTTFAPKKGWIVPKGKKALSLTICRNANGTLFNLTAQAGQKLYAYDTLQGATAGKGFAYFSLFNRKNNRVKIVKVRLKDMMVVKVSAPLDITHGNEFAYNGKKNIIVVANSGGRPKRLSVINASTLTVMYHKTLKVSRKVKGMSKKQRKKYKGVGAIAYNEKHDCYICRMKKSNDLLFLDSNLKPYKRVKQKSKVSKMLYQGMDSYQDCIMICQSFKGRKKYNLITVYNMKGKFLARFKMSLGRPARELETVFHNGNQFYAGCYTCYGAKSDTAKMKIQRDNYIYRINNL